MKNCLHEKWRKTNFRTNFMNLASGNVMGFISYFSFSLFFGGNWEGWWFSRLIFHAGNAPVINFHGKGNRGELWLKGRFVGSVFEILLANDIYEGFFNQLFLIQLFRVFPKNPTQRQPTSKRSNKISWNIHFNLSKKQNEKKLPLIARKRSSAICK